MQVTSQSSLYQGVPANHTAATEIAFASQVNIAARSN
jgi:hypothetical protein